MRDLIKSYIESIEKDAERRGSSLYGNAQNLYYLHKLLEVYPEVNKTPQEAPQKPKVKKPTQPTKKSVKATSEAPRGSEGHSMVKSKKQKEV